MTTDVAALYRAHGPMVLRRCRRLLRDEGKAVDAMHDVFVEILKRHDRLHDAAPAALLLRVATHVCLNRLRSERRHPEDRDEALLLAIAGPHEDVEARALARRLLGRVLGRSSESTQLMAVLHYVDRLTLEEVALEVGLSVSGVRKRLRALARERPLPVEAP
jgi:RNA polymerase sigma-70 factor (ECF subfamily)